MQKIVKYPIGIQDFGYLREYGFTYVDKTEYVYRLVNEGKYYFLSRPRRFGKSLMLSTIGAYLEGRRDLFKGLALDRLTDDWTPYPVIRIDLNNAMYDKPESVANHLGYVLSKYEKEYGINHIEKEISARFATLIREIHNITGHRVGILVDEYDKPLLAAIHDNDLADYYREVLKAFYGNLKTMDAHIRFAMLTGVARFSKVSIFSDLNNLRDISFVSSYAGICGLTETELESYFRDGIDNLASTFEILYTDCLEMLRRQYDGYHFSWPSPGVYNPWSVLNCLANQDVRDYWFESGTPTFLIKLLQKSHWPLHEVPMSKIDAQTLSTTGIMTQDPLVLLYQTGYLTIKSKNEFGEFILNYPNLEVRKSFLETLLNSYCKIGETSNEFTIANFVSEVRKGLTDEFMRRLQSLTAGVPYSEKGAAPEAHFHNVIYLVFTLMGIYTKMEQRTSNGRIDVTVETDRFVYIFEFKTDSSAQSAINQIIDKDYAGPFRSSDKEIILVGVNFDTATRRISGWETKIDSK